MFRIRPTRISPPLGLLSCCLLLGASSASALSLQILEESRPLRDTDLALTGQYARDECMAVLLQGDTLYYGSGKVLEVRLLLANGDNQVLGSRQFEEGIRELILDGDLLVVKTLSTVQLLRNQAPNFPRQGVLENWSGFPFTMKVHDDALYLATYNGVDVYDIGNLQSPALVTTLHGGQPCFDLEVGDQTLFVKGRLEGNQYGLSSFDLGNPLDPEPLGMILTDPANLQGFCLRDSILFSLAGLTLTSYDISQPGEFQAIGSLPLGSMSYMVNAAPDQPLVLLNDYLSGARLLDVSDPIAIQSLPPLGTDPILAISVSWENQRLALSSQSRDLAILDVSQPSSPQVTHLVDHGGGTARELALCGPVLAASYQGGTVRLLQGDSPDALAARERLTGFSCAPLLAASGTLLAAADSQHVALFRVENDESSALLANLNLNEMPSDIALGSNWLAAVNPAGPIQIWNLSIPETPVALPEAARPLAGVARLAACSQGLLVWQASSLFLLDPQDGSLPPLGLALGSAILDLAVDGETALLALANGQSRLVSLSSDALVVLGSASTPAVQRVALSDGWAWIHTPDHRWQLLDVNDPQAPVWHESWIDPEAYIGSVAMSGHTLFSTNVSMGILRLRNTLANHPPVWNAPGELFFEEDGTGFLSLAGSLVDADLDRFTLQISPSENLQGQLVGEQLQLTASADWNGQETLELLAFDGYAEDAAVHPLVVTVSAVNDSPLLQACGLDCNTELAPEELSGLGILAEDVDGDNLELVWLADGEPFAQQSLFPQDLGQCLEFPLDLLPAGASVIHAQLADGEFVVNENGELCAWSLTATGVESAVLPGSWRLDNVVPNPFNPSTRIVIRAGSAGSARLAVYDLQGRLQEVLWQGPLASGSHAFVWQAGSRASGIYLAVLETSSGRQVQRMTLLK